MKDGYLKNTWTVTTVILARLRFVAVFVLAGLIVGYWQDIKNHVDKWTRPPVAPDALAAEHLIEWFCPMHPDVIRAETGSCPKCGMPLVKRKKDEATPLPDDVLARVQLSPRRIALAGIQTSAVERRALVREIRAVGVLDYDETKLARLSARIAGRADELFVTYTGQSISRGDAIYSLYSPEVYSAQREYLAARKRVNELPKGASEQTKSDAGAVYNAGLQKLVLWGLTTEQLDKLDHIFDETAQVPTNLSVVSPISGIVVKKEITQGQYVDVGDSPYSVADLGKLWLQIKLFERDIPLVNIGDTVALTVDAFPGETFNGTVAFKSFQLDPATRTLDARVVVDNPGIRLRAGMYAAARISVPVMPTLRPVNGSAMTNMPEKEAKVLASAMELYLKAQVLLAADQSQGVAGLLDQAAQALVPIAHLPEFAEDFQKLMESSRRMKDQPIDAVREQFRIFSTTLIAIGKRIGVHSGMGDVKVYRCPMKKALWLQMGDVTANPYYGSEMQTCGSAVESLPKASEEPAPTTRPVPSAAMTLSIPRSALVDTGERQIVYIESSPGVYDMRAVTVGQRAGEFYPVLTGLDESDRVVTVGTFLVDAENRMNPTIRKN